MLLRPIDKERLINIFSGINVPVEVWAYGSRVNGKAHEGSDLDLVIRSHNLSPLPIALFSSVYDAIKNSNIPILVELKDWARLPDYFHKNIVHQYEILFDNRNMFEPAQEDLKQ